MNTTTGLPRSSRLRYLLYWAAQLAIDYGHEAVLPQHLILSATSPQVRKLMETSEHPNLPELGADDQKLGAVEWSSPTLEDARLTYEAAEQHYRWVLPSASELERRRQERSPKDVPLNATTAMILRAAEERARNEGHPMVALAHLFWTITDPRTTTLASQLLPPTANQARIYEAARRTAEQYGLVHRHNRTSRSARSPETPRSTATTARRSRRGELLADQFCRDLTELAREGRLDPVVGRDKEMDALVSTLMRRTKNNVALVGPAGAGKTAIVEGLAQRIASGDVPNFLKDARVLELDLGQLEAGTRYRGDFEERFANFIDELTTHSTPTVLFIDELHTLMGSGRANPSDIGAVNMLKPLMARTSNLWLVGATTPKEWKLIEKDSALTRRFRVVDVPPLTVEATYKVLTQIAPVYAEFHSVEFSPETLRFIADTAHKYFRSRALPDPAIELLDASAVHHQLFNPDAGPQVTIAEVAAEAEAICGVPVSLPTSERSSELMRLEEMLGRRVIGQAEALSAVARAVRRRAVGLNRGQRVAGAFLFVGPSGVGKTETAKALAEFLFGDSSALIPIDMSEYMEAHSVSRLVGAAPGYVGHDEGGQLTNAVARKPYSVILFDEVEKAHPQVLNVLLQLLEEGRLTDGSGRTVDFSNCYVIATSNAGSFDASRNVPGFVSRTDRSAEYANAIKSTFAPELRNRFDEIVVFSDLTVDDLAEVVRIQVADMAERLRESRLLAGDAEGDMVHVSDDAVRLIADRAAAGMGARDVRRILTREVEDQIAEAILSHDGAAPASVTVEAVDGQIRVTVIPARRPDRELVEHAA